MRLPPRCSSSSSTGRRHHHVTDSKVRRFHHRHEFMEWLPCRLVKRHDSFWYYTFATSPTTTACDIRDPLSFPARSQPSMYFETTN